MLPPAKGETVVFYLEIEMLIAHSVSRGFLDLRWEHLVMAVPADGSCQSAVGTES